jgi:hypothetical protein
MNGECAGRANSGLRPALKKTMTAADAFYPGLCVVAKADEEREETSWIFRFKVSHHSGESEPLKKFE